MVCRTHKYADGGKIVVRPDRPPVRGSSTKSSGVSGAVKDAVSTVAKSTDVGNTLANKRKQQMEELGLKDGGKVRGRKR